MGMVSMRYLIGRTARPSGFEGSRLVYWRHVFNYSYRKFSIAVLTFVPHVPALSQALQVGWASAETLDRV